MKLTMPDNLIEKCDLNTPPYSGYKRMAKDKYVTGVGSTIQNTLFDLCRTNHIIVFGGIKPFTRNIGGYDLYYSAYGCPVVKAKKADNELLTKILNKTDKLLKLFHSKSSGNYSKINFLISLEKLEDKILEIDENCHFAIHPCFIKLSDSGCYNISTKNGVQWSCYYASEDFRTKYVDLIVALLQRYSKKYFGEFEITYNS